MDALSPCRSTQPHAAAIFGCSLFIWDCGFGNYQEVDPNFTIDYGITRPINSGSFVQVYFGEFIHLVKDVINAPGIANKFRYLFYPPGWSHDSGHQTAKMIRKAYLTKNE